MNKHLVAVFAHPDDEAFGPSGSLLMETAAGTSLHLILLTAGEAGINHSGGDLSRLRLDEWQQSAKRLGATSRHFLGYQDGRLTNQDMQQISQKIIELIQQQTIEAEEIELMSFEFGGISGHIDHIVAARATAAAFYKLKSADNRLTRLRLFCLPESISSQPNTDWIFVDKGYAENQIDQVVDARHLIPQINAVIDAHASQSQDAAYVRRLYGEYFGLNWFVVMS